MFLNIFSFCSFTELMMTLFPSDHNGSADSEFVFYIMFINIFEEDFLYVNSDSCCFRF